MLPTKKTYKIYFRVTEFLTDEIYLSSHVDHVDRFQVHSPEKSFLLMPWMSKQDLVAWFRKAADLIEEAKFE